MLIIKKKKKVRDLENRFRTPNVANIIYRKRNKWKRSSNEINKKIFPEIKKEFIMQIDVPGKISVEKNPPRLILVKFLNSRDSFWRLPDRTFIYL